MPMIIRSRSTRGLCVSAAAALTAFALSTGASAQGDAQRTATAAALRDQAVKSMAAGDYASACPRLEEAMKLEPEGVGAAVALAECYEGAGRLQSAWGAYLRAEAVAIKANQLVEQKKAHARAEALAPRLAHVIIAVPDQVKALPGLSILGDGMEIGPGLWGVPLPLDKGEHVIVVKATGRRRLDMKVIATDGETTAVNVQAPPAEPPPPALPPPPQPGWTPPPQGVIVHIKSDDPSKPLTLRRVDSDFSGAGPMFGYGQGGPTYGVLAISGNVNSVVCLAPCGGRVTGPTGQEFFLGGDGIRPSSHFMLPSTGTVYINASPGSQVGFTVGMWLVILGAAFAITAPFAVVGGNSTPDGGTLTTYGWGSLGGGLAALAIGIPLMVNGRTTYSIDEGKVAIRF